MLTPATLRIIPSLTPITIMNRFRTKKKAKDESALDRTSTEDAPSMPSFKGFRRNKKSQEEEPKKEIDLTTALPSSDDFRTSLLMTGLSARFSMLREQDDPNTKIGKASDDSVLYPKRQSRLMDFGYGPGLTDIAEVESIRAPFARADSYASDDADSIQGSMMTRSKPIEGNNLFGGRQKIYKIPAGASKAGAGAMGGRALYGDDVAQSAFQRWRQDEREKQQALEDNERKSLESPGVEEEQSGQRSQSPFSAGYNRRRETSSTTSSFARNSTAATSVVSQAPPSLKDWQSQSTAPSSAASTPALDRSVTRTRRLYEQGLNQDLHNQQSSALSRIDTLSGKKGLGARTPELSQASSSPTMFGFGDRFGTERRPILSKASAPNLRSMSPPATGSSVNSMDLGLKLPSVADMRTNFVSTPPLSPPISESSEAAILPIQPNDRGKATAMGVFQKPVQPYDESKYAQRQLQLQQGRETPTQRFRAESIASLATGGSRSSSTHRRESDAPIKVDSAKDFTSPSSFLDDEDDDASETMPDPPAPVVGLPRVLERPADEEHPLFRQSALPTPLSMTSNGGEAPSPLSEQIPTVAPPSQPISPQDSPTLGPTAGLSGMVRQHLRSESNSSSVYGAAPRSSGLDFLPPLNVPSDTHIMDSLGVRTNPWQNNDWSISFYDNEDGADKISEQVPPTAPPPTQSQMTKTEDIPSDSILENQEEEDEFATQLASARRRVQERLTSYVESDSSRAGSPQLAPVDSVPPPVSRSNPLGILRGKSSRGSLAERSREPSQSKAMKMLGIGAVTMSTTPSPSKQSFDDFPAESTKVSDAPREIQPAQPAQSTQPAQSADIEKQAMQDKEEDENVHPGLRAFRQARRELQKRKELETLAKHQATHAQPDNQASNQHWDQMRQRAPSSDRKPPPLSYQNRAPSAESYRSHGSNSQSPARSERDRSGSDSSTGRTHHRPPPLRSESDFRGDASGQLGPNSSRRNGPPRPLGLPGTDIRRSPIMPPNGYSGALASPHMDRSASAGNLTVQQPRQGGNLSGQPSPISPLSMGLPASPLGIPTSPFMGGSANGSGTTTPTTASAPRRPTLTSAQTGSTTTSSLDESMKRVVKKKDISEPTFIMSTSRVPTVSLPQNGSSPDSKSGGNGRLRAGSNAAHPPPLPPINPMRNREPSRTRTVIGNLMGRNGETGELASHSTPHLPSAASTGSLYQPPAYDDDDALMGAHRLRKQASEANGMNLRAAGQLPPRVRPPIPTGPPASRTVVTSSQNDPSGMGAMPGGMI